MMKREHDEARWKHNLSQAEIDGYRRDGRSLDQFALDVKEGTEKEQWIADKYVQILKARGEPAVVTNHGCGNDGRLLSADKISTAADFLLNGHPLEVKFANNWCNRFRFKVDQIVSYVNQDANLLFVNGLETPSPCYLLFTVGYLRWLLLHGEVVHYEGWQKDVYELKANRFMWAKFI
jgi:hypothetical protein